jgi:hypothetical protein
LTIVDSTGGGGLNSSLAFGPGGQPSIAYRNLSDYHLKYAVFDGALWQITTLDSTHVTWNPSLAFLAAGRPAIAYYDYTEEAVKYAEQLDGPVWNFSVVANVGSTLGAVRPSLAISPGGRPAVAFMDIASPAVRFAYYNGTTWHVSVVDRSSDSGQFASLAFTPAGQPSASYYDSANGDLKYAVRSAFIAP